MTGPEGPDSPSINPQDMIDEEGELDLVSDPESDTRGPEANCAWCKEPLFSSGPGWTVTLENREKTVTVRLCPNCWENLDGILTTAVSSEVNA